MGLSPLHKLAQMIQQGEAIEDRDLLETLGDDGTIVVPLRGGGERHLPSGEILSVLADATGLSLEQVLSRSFRLNHDEVETVRQFISLVQFTGGVPNAVEHPYPEEPIQPLDR